MTPSTPCLSQPSLSSARRTAERSGFWQWLLGAGALRRQRRDLSRLNDALLKDIGITRAQADAESIRPFWDAPTHWRG